MWTGMEMSFCCRTFLGTDDDEISRRLEDEVEIRLLGKAISKLSPREQTIIKLRFGLGTTRRPGENPERGSGSAWNFAVLYFAAGEADYEEAEKGDCEV